MFATDPSTTKPTTRRPAGTESARAHVAALGACLSDLTAHLFALVTESEAGPGLDQRLVDVLASLGSVRHHAVQVVITTCTAWCRLSTRRV